MAPAFALFNLARVRLSPCVLATEPAPRPYSQNRSTCGLWPKVSSARDRAGGSCTRSALAAPGRVLHPRFCCGNTRRGAHCAPQCAPREASVSWSSYAVCFSRASTRKVTRQGAKGPQTARFLLNAATGPAGFDPRGPEPGGPDRLIKIIGRDKVTLVGPHEINYKLWQ
jgi:hypothetical protein